MSAQEVDARTEAAIEELKALIRGRFPGAQFRIGVSPDDAAITELVAVIDDDDPSQVLDLVIDRQMELQIDEGLPIFVVTEPTPERASTLVTAAQAAAPARRSAS